MNAKSRRRKRKNEQNSDFCGSRKQINEANARSGRDRAKGVEGAVGDSAEQAD